MLNAKEAAAQTEVRKKEVFKQNTEYLLKSCKKQIDDHIYSGCYECKVDCSYITDNEAIQHVMDYLGKLGYKTHYLPKHHSCFPHTIKIEWYKC